MEITKVVKPFIKRGWPNTFGNRVYITHILGFIAQIVYLFHYFSTFIVSF